MSPSIVLVNGADRRAFAAGDLPISVGGAGCDLRVEGAADQGAAAYLGVADGAVFIQPAAETDLPIHCNGVVVTASRWLHDGDRLAIGRTRVHVRVSGGVVEIETEQLTRPSSGTERSVGPVSPPPQRVIMVEPVPFTPFTGASTPTRRRFRTGAVILWAALILVGAVGWFVLTGRTIEIVIHPTPERVEVDGRWPVFDIDGRTFMHPGSYRVEAELTGHRPLVEELEIGPDTASVIELTMEPLPGRLRITTGEVSDAAILVDGEPRATSPAEIELPVGEYAIIIRAQRHAEATRRVTINEPDQLLEIDIALDPAWASVSFTTAPSGARVVVDGQTLGTTPLTTELGAGRHTVDYILTGYARHRAPITVAAGEQLELPTVRLPRAAARIRLTSDPPRASVTIDDEFEGVTPLTVELVPDLDHEITLAKGGFELHTSTVHLAPGEERSLSVELAALRGTVRFTSTPPGAELLIDGQPRGRTATEIELAERMHRVEFRLEGYLPFTTAITPRAAMVSHVDAELESVDLARRRPPVVTSPQGVELRLIDGGRFTAGASRRVPGRRANETLLEVEITRPFYIAVREVTNREFRAFRESHRSGAAGGANLEIDHHPAVRMSWDNAARYCNWLSQQESLPPVYVERQGRMVPLSPQPAGYRLPTEAEWVWAARYDAQGRMRKYGWGDDLPIPPKAGNYGDRSADAILGNSLPGYDDGHPATSPAGSFTANPRGLFNMGGNVSEWVQDLYTIHPPNGSAVMVDPTGPSEGEYHVIRGASWMDDNVTELRLSYRDYGDEPRPDVGFRIARSVD